MYLMGVEKEREAVDKQQNLTTFFTGKLAKPKIWCIESERSGPHLLSFKLTYKTVVLALTWISLSLFTPFLFTAVWCSCTHLSFSQLTASRTTLGYNCAMNNSEQKELGK